MCKIVYTLMNSEEERYKEIFTRYIYGDFPQYYLFCLKDKYTNFIVNIA